MIKRQTSQHAHYNQILDKTLLHQIHKINIHKSQSRGNQLHGVAFGQNKNQTASSTA